VLVSLHKMLSGVINTIYNKWLNNLYAPMAVDKLHEYTTHRQHYAI
jgi:hypothetical protein